MKKAKRLIRRPWGRMHRGGWIILNEELRKALKGADSIEMKTLMVGAKKLDTLVKLIDTSDSLLIKTNGRLEITAIDRIVRKDKDGHFKTSFRKARLEQSFRIENNAGMPETPALTVVLRPRKYA